MKFSIYSITLITIIFFASCQYDGDLEQENNITQKRHI